jgi:hypothetical protein
VIILTNYLTDIGRAKVDEDDGISILLMLLNSLLGNTKSGTDKLRTIACGFLLNLTNSNGELKNKT